MSTVNRFQLVDRLFRATLHLPEHEREPYLNEQCSGDADLKSEILALLREDQASSGALDVPALGAPIDLASIDERRARTAPLPQSIGRYRIIRVIGEGGMGIVYEAEQSDPRRRVALKIIRPEMVTPRMRHRFRQEVHALGQLAHPGIAQIYDAGTVDDREGGAPYFAMELIAGESLLEFARSHRLSTSQRLELILLICDAVQHAHEHDIVHRDLKPANILVVDDATQSRGTAMPRPSSPQPKVLDFGVARATDADLQTITLQTNTGQLIGTLPYMSPEQAAGDPANIDAQSDLYALGVITYELLTGRLPYDVRHKLMHEAVRMIREVDPSSLSTADRTFAGDLDTIVRKALEKEKSRRYASVAEFAADLRRFLRDEPIQARRPSAMYQFAKFAKRNRVAVAAAALIVLALVGGLIGTSYGLVQMTAARNSEREQTELAKELAKQAEQRAQELLAVSEFQASQFDGIDTALMGSRLRNALIAERRDALQRAGADEAGIADRLADLDADLKGVNFTNLALTSLDENIFQRARTAIEEEFADQPSVKARLLHALAVTLRDLGLLAEATEPQLQALTIRSETLGSDHPETLQSTNSLAVLLTLQGKLAEVEPYAQAALEGYQRVLGDDHPSTLTALSTLGTLRHKQGKFDEAEQLLRASLEGRRRVLGNDNPFTLNAINQLANVLDARGQVAESESLYRESLETRIRVHGEDHPDTLIAKYNMAYLLQNKGRLKEAEQYYREALEGRRQAFGDHHQATLQSIGGLSEVLFLQGRLDEAAPFFARVLEGRRKLLGDEHLETLVSINNMAMLLQRQQKHAQAETYFREALEIRRRVLGPDHQHTLVSLHNMGGVYEVQGDAAKAEPYFRQTLEARRRVLGDDHSQTLNSIIVLSRTLRTLGRLDEALALGEEAVERASRTLGKSHWLRGFCMSELATTLAHMQQFTRAETLALEAHETLNASFGPTHPRTKGAAKTLIDLYEAWHLADPNLGHDANATTWRDRLTAAP